MLLLLLPPEPLLPLQPFNQTPCYVASKKKIQPHIHLEIAYITKWMKKRKIGIGKKQANISNADGKVFQWVFSSSNRHLALIFCMLQKCDLDGFFFSHLSFEITNLLLFVVFFYYSGAISISYSVSKKKNIWIAVVVSLFNKLMNLVSGEYNLSEMCYQKKRKTTTTSTE